MQDIEINNRTLNITLGRAGENEVRRLIMDVSDWEIEFPGGSLALFMERPDGVCYNAAVEQQEAAWIHVVSAADTGAAGRGRIQMQWILNQQIARSRIMGTIILPSMECLGEPPDPPEEGYLEQMAAIGAQATKDAQTAADSAQAAGQSAAQAQTSAEAAAQSATQAQGSAQAAGASAESAEQSARQAQNSAQSAAQSATQAQGNAQAAQATADKLSGLGAEAQTLPAGSEATVTVGENKIIYGIPRGDKGEPGSQGPQGEPGKDAPQIDDTQITPDHPWSSLKTVDALCPAFTESGNPIVCYPVEGYPLGVAASWTPKQGGTGDPGPDNVRPIRGRENVKIIRCGKNLLDMREARKTTRYNIGHMPNLLIPEKEYTYKPNDIDTYAFGVFASKTNANIDLDNIPISGGYTSNGQSRTFTAPQIVKDYPYLFLGGGSEGAADVFDRGATFQIEVGHTATNYEPYRGDTFAIMLPEMIYGGEVDVATGAGSETYHVFILDGTEEWSSAANGSTGLQYFNVVLSNEAALRPSSGGSIDLAKESQLISHFKIGNPYTENVDNAGWVYGTETSSNVGGRIRMSAYDGDVDGFKSYLAAQKEAGTPVTIAYKLATPIPFQTTSGASIPALAGTNTISTDADSLTVTGRADPNRIVRALSERVAALENAAITNNNGGMQS